MFIIFQTRDEVILFEKKQHLKFSYIYVGNLEMKEEKKIETQLEIALIKKY